MADPKIERDVYLAGKTEAGEDTIDLPVTRLGNIEDSADVKARPAEDDYFPVIDGKDKHMKKYPAKVLLDDVK